MRTLVIYDISDDNRRSKLREHAMNYGLRPIQYSGLLGEVNSHDRFVLTREVEKYLSSEKDSIYIIPLCDGCLKLCKIISKQERSMGEEDVEIVDGEQE
jgi:CRISPR-associated protein Cas2